MKNIVKSPTLTIGTNESVHIKDENNKLKWHKVTIVEQMRRNSKYKTKWSNGDDDENLD